MDKNAALKITQTLNAASERLTDEFDQLHDYGEISEQELDDLYEIEEEFSTKAKGYCCKLIGHDFIVDQCGHEAHQFCVRCNISMYPKLAIMRCGDIDKLKTDNPREYERLHVPVH